MRVHIDSNLKHPLQSPQVGNVYTRRGGRAAARGEMAIIISIVPAQPHEGEKAVMLFVDKQGQVTGADTYNLSYWEDKVPIAIAEGIQDLDIVIKSL